MGRQAGFPYAERSAAPLLLTPIRCLSTYDYHRPPVFSLLLTGKLPRSSIVDRSRGPVGTAARKTAHTARLRHLGTDEESARSFARRLLCRRSGAGGVMERRQEVGLALLDLGEVLFLHVAEAADLLGQGGDLDGEGVVAGVERGDDRRHRRLVVADETPFGLALLAVAEDVEGRAAQALQLGQQLEGLERPGAVGALLQLAGRRVALAEEGRGGGLIQLEISFALRVRALDGLHLL